MFLQWHQCVHMEHNIPAQQPRTVLSSHALMVMRWKGDTLKLNAIYINIEDIMLMEGCYGICLAWWGCQNLVNSWGIKRCMLANFWSCSEETRSELATTTFKTWIPPLKGALARCLHLYEMVVAMLPTSSAFICTVIEHQQEPRAVFHETFVNLHFRRWTHSDGNCICEASKVVIVESGGWSLHLHCNTANA
jgi:hypothetical protein